MRYPAQYLFTPVMLLTLAALFMIRPADASAEDRPNFGPATRETDRAVSDAARRKLTGKMMAPAKVSITVDDGSRGAAADPGTPFFVQEIVFAGMRAFTPRDLSGITRRYTGRDITSGEINELTKEIEMEYLRHGMVSVVFVPQQDVVDGILRIQVMEPDPGVN